MRIAYVSELVGSKKEGGGNIAAKNLYESMISLGYEADLYSYYNGINSIIPCKIKEFPHLHQFTVMPLLGKSSLKKFEIDYDIIHLMSTTTSALYKPNIPSVITIHSILYQQAESRAASHPLRYRLLYNHLSRNLARRMELKSIHNADHIITLKQETKDFLLNELGNYNSKDISVIPNGVDTDLFHPTSEKVENYVIFVGRGTIAKGFDILLDAGPQIKAKIIVVTNSISPNYFQVAERQAVDLHFSISHVELSALYRKSKIFVLPSLDEQQPLTVLEAMASGLPIVTTKVGASNLVKDGVNGIIVPPKNPEALAEAINYLLENPEIARRMGKINRNLIEKEYSWIHIAKEIGEIYNSLVR